MDCSALQTEIIQLIESMDRRCLVAVFMMRGRLADGFLGERINRRMNPFASDAWHVYIILVLV